MEKPKFKIAFIDDTQQVNGEPIVLLYWDYYKLKHPNTYCVGFYPLEFKEPTK